MNNAAQQLDILQQQPACSLISFPAHDQPRTPSLMDVRDAARFLGVSESWIRRHAHELPAVRVGRLVRFDPALMLRKFSGRPSGSGKSLKQGKESFSMLRRYQQGYVYKTGRKVKVWYGMYREDVRNPDGTLARRQRNVRLGTLSELPTKNAAREKLAELFRNSRTTTEVTFDELRHRWLKAEGPTLKNTTLNHYENALRAYILPSFGNRMIAEIRHEDVQLFLADQALKYSKSALRSMRAVLSLTLGWAKKNKWLEQNPCEGLRLPKNALGKKVQRVVLTPEQVSALVNELHEPYATLVLFLAASGLRIGEAIAVKWSDFNGNVLHVTRRIYDGNVDTVKSDHSERKLPIDAVLLARMRQLGNTEWVFQSRDGTPLNPGNALKRHVRPAAQKLGIPIGGWHDFRHSLTTALRRSGAHPRVISGVLGHSKVALAMEVYDHTDVDDFREPLSIVAGELLRPVTKNGSTP